MGADHGVAQSGIPLVPRGVRPQQGGDGGHQQQGATDGLGAQGGRDELGLGPGRATEDARALRRLRHVGVSW